MQENNSSIKKWEKLSSGKWKWIAIFIGMLTIFVWFAPIERINALANILMILADMM